MSKRSYIFAIIILFLLALSLPQGKVQAIPLLPSSFYGTALVNNLPVIDGTTVQALIADQVVASGSTQTYQGNSFYALDIPSDDETTTVVDGGKEGDTIRFSIGGLPVAQTGTWHSGTNVELNLAVTASATLLPPQPTKTSLPTQTPIPVIQPSSTPSATLFLPSATIPVSNEVTSLPSLEVTKTDIATIVTTERLTGTTGSLSVVSPTSGILPTDESRNYSQSRRKAQYLAIGIILLSTITVLVVIVRGRIFHKEN
jgi:hypothetical protein